MSPIYSVTSFLSLVWPSTEGYLAIVKDGYEAYCIYTFLSFLIAVLGRGDRDVAVQVLAKHANHLDTPSRFLRRWYHPPPETSDEAMASAVITECQLMAMQFVFIRPLTSIALFVVNYLADAEDRDNAYQDTTQSEFDSDPYLNNKTLWDNDNSNNLNGISSNNNTASNTTSSIMSDPQQFQEATKTYFTSPSFVIAMVVNVSIFFAFMVRGVSQGRRAISCSTFIIMLTSHFFLPNKNKGIVKVLSRRARRFSLVSALAQISDNQGRRLFNLLARIGNLHGCQFQARRTAYRY